MRVLCYHSFTAFGRSSPLWEYGLPVEQLDRHLAAYARWGYRILTPAELFASLAGERAIGRRELAVTIDDGYLDNLGAGGVFERHRVTPLLFAVAGQVGGVSEWMDPPHQPLLEVGQYRDLMARGWEIGSHSFSHPFLTRLDDSALERQLRGSKLALEDHGFGPVRAIAYPHGLHDQRVRAAARLAGYDFGFVLETDPVDDVDDPFAITRMEVLRSYSLSRLRAMLASPGALARRHIDSERLARRVRAKIGRLVNNAGSSV